MEGVEYQNVFSTVEFDTGRMTLVDNGETDSTRQHIKQEVKEQARKTQEEKQLEKENYKRKG